MQKICVLGGNGFLGTNLIKRLNANLDKHEIYCADIDKEDSKNFLYVDVTKPTSFDCIADKDIDVIINLAAVHRDDIKPISKYDEVNVDGAKNVCEIANKYGINKIIFTSSVAIYGFAPPNTKESGEPNYFNDYGRTKYLAEQVYKKWLSEDEINRSLVIIRPTVIFGKGNRGNVYNLLKQIASRKFVMIGNGKNKKSMAYVENVTAFIEYCLSFKEGLHTYNYIDKPDLDMNSLVKNVRQILFKKNNIGVRLPAFIGVFAGYVADLISILIQKSLPVSSIRVKKFMGTTQFNSSIDKTNFIAPITLEKGLAKTIRYEFIEDNSSNRIFKTE
jgi:nucleoside-diphosphate-sugar epimerase